MTPALLHRLFSGMPDAAAEFTDTCVVVDWRDRLPEILDAAAGHLPENYIRVLSETESSVQVQIGTRPPETVAWEPKTAQEQLLLRVNQLLAPEYEMRQFLPINGDGYALYLAPATTWKEIDTSHPEAVKKLFLSVDRMAAFWSKPFLVRLFTKP